MDERPENYPSDATQMREYCQNTAHAGTACLLKRSTFCFGVPMLVNSTYYHVLEIIEGPAEECTERDSDDATDGEKAKQNLCSSKSDSGSAGKDLPETMDELVAVHHSPAAAIEPEEAAQTQQQLWATHIKSGPTRK